MKEVEIAYEETQEAEVQTETEIVEMGKINTNL